MKKAALLIGIAITVISLSACAGRKNEGVSDEMDGTGGTESEESLPESSDTGIVSNKEIVSNTETVSTTETEEAAKTVGDMSENGSMEADEKEQSRILIAYFTWAENTHVENPEAVDVDATTSASVLPPSNAAKMAGWIQEEIGRDLFSIVVTESYSSDYDECLDRAADEKADNARPNCSTMWKICRTTILSSWVSQLVGIDSHADCILFGGV